MAKILFITCILLNIIISNANAFEFKFIPNKHERLRECKKFLKLIELLDAYIPNLKPSEKKWYEEEKKALQIMYTEKRQMELDRSVEHNIISIKDELKNIKKSIGNILKPNISLKKEVAWWSQLAIQLISNHDLNKNIDVLENNNKIDLNNEIIKKLNLAPVKGERFFFLEVRGKIAYALIVKTYLFDQLKE